MDTNPIFILIKRMKGLKDGISESAAQITDVSSWNASNPFAKLISEYIISPISEINRYQEFKDICMVTNELNSYFTTMSSLSVVRNCLPKSKQVNKRSVAGLDIFLIHDALCLMYLNGDIMRTISIAALYLTVDNKLTISNIDNFRSRIVATYTFAGKGQFIHNYVNKVMAYNTYIRDIRENTGAIKYIVSVTECIARGPRPEDAELYKFFEPGGWDSDSQLREFKKSVIREVLIRSNEEANKNNMSLGVLMGRYSDDDELTAYLLHLLNDGATGNTGAYYQLSICISAALSVGKVVAETVDIKIVETMEMTQIPRRIVLGLRDVRSMYLAHA